jgi:hypothetical protein
MVMGNQDVAELGELRASENKLPRHAIAAIHNVCDVIDDYDLGWGRPGPLRAWSTGCPQENEPSTCCRSPVRREQCCGSKP